MALDCESMTVGSIAIVKLNINFNSFNLKYYDLCSFVQRLSSNKYHMLMPFVLERVPFLLIQNVIKWSYPDLLIHLLKTQA